LHFCARCTAKNTINVIYKHLDTQRYGNNQSLFIINRIGRDIVKVEHIKGMKKILSLSQKKLYL
jgi:hypothetical protein